MRTTLTHRTRILGASAALGLALLGGAPAQAATTPNPTSAVCVSRFTATFTPGFSMTPSTGTVSTNGTTGSFTCSGRIGGDRVTGPGSVGVEESYSGSCLAHVGTGTVHIIVPTTGGPKDMTGTLSVRRSGLFVSPSVLFPDARLRGIGVTLPSQGNCFVTPLKQAQIALVGVMRGR